MVKKMLKKSSFVTAIMAASISVGLTACGGGGGSSNSGSPTTEPNTGSDGSAEVKTGQFVDSPVAGLEYTRSSAGTDVFLTNENGQFSYLDGETVTFSIGQYTIGSAQGKSTVSPRDLGSETGAVNVARVLQTLDEDQDPSNGITIAAQVRSKASQASTARNISRLQDLDSIASEILDISSNSATTLVSATQAKAHLDETLGSIAGAEISSCSDTNAVNLSSSDLAGSTIGFLDPNEILIFDFHLGEFTEYNSGDLSSGAPFQRNGEWSLDEATQTLSLTFINESGQEETERFGICDAGNRLLFETDGRSDPVYKLNQAVEGERAAGTYQLEFPDETGAIVTIATDGNLTYFQGEDIVTAASTTVKGNSVINWGAPEPDDRLLFLAGQTKRTGIYLDIGEDGTFARLGSFGSVAPIVNQVPTEADIAGLTSLYRSGAANDVVVFSFGGDGHYVEYYNDSYNGDVRVAAGKRSGTWTLLDGVLTLNETNGDAESYRVALSATTLYFALKSESNGDLSEVNRVTATSIDKAITASSFEGSYAVSIPTEGANENLVISGGGSCDYSGTGCNWEIQNGKAVITFGAGNDATGHVWQMANRANGFIFVMTHENDPADIEPGFMFRE